MKTFCLWIERFVAVLPVGSTLISGTLAKTDAHLIAEIQRSAEAPHPPSFSQNYLIAIDFSVNFLSKAMYLTRRPHLPITPASFNIPGVDLEHVVRLWMRTCTKTTLAFCSPEWLHSRLSPSQDHQKDGLALQSLSGSIRSGSLNDKLHLRAIFQHFSQITKCLWYS